jgi:two-component system OmpR family response regulator
MRVLIVEDDPMIGEAVEVALKNASYAADWVKDGPTALDAVNSQNYDLILLDLGLPGKDGLDVLTRIRAKGNSVSLLIITARDDLDDRVRGLDNGMVSLDPATREATVSGGSPVQLSNREFALFQALMARPGAILSRSDLEDRVYGWGEEVESNAIEFLIHSLRRKLTSDVIRNVRGAGWMVSKTS